MWKDLLFEQLLHHALITFTAWMSKDQGQFERFWPVRRLFSFFRFSLSSCVSSAIPFSLWASTICILVSFCDFSSSAWSSARRSFHSSTALSNCLCLFSNWTLNACDYQSNQQKHSPYHQHNPYTNQDVMNRALLSPRLKSWQTEWGLGKVTGNLPVPVEAPHKHLMTAISKKFWPSKRN